jgi:hypothetical protein
MGLTNNSTLFYATGGLAITRIENNYTLLSSPGNTGNSACAAPFLVTGSTSFTSSIHVYDQILRVALNYKFGEGPLLAKY